MLFVGLLAIEHDVSTACMECSLHYVDHVNCASELHNSTWEVGKYLGDEFLYKQMLYPKHKKHVSSIA